MIRMAKIVYIEYMKRLCQYEYFYLLPLLLSAIFSLKSFRLKWPKPYRLIAVLVILTFFTEITAIGWKWYWHDSFSWNYSKNNFWIYNLFLSLYLGISLAAFYHMLRFEKLKRTIVWSAPLLVIFGLLNYALIQGPLYYNSYTVALVHFSVIALCLAYFKQLLEESGIITLHKEPFVWFTLGTFIYLSGSLPFLIMLRFLNTQRTGLSALFLPINDTLNLILCFCYLISFICKPQLAQHPLPS
jgi:hypothetical protein